MREFMVTLRDLHCMYKFSFGYRMTGNHTDHPVNLIAPNTIPYIRKLSLTVIFSQVFVWVVIKPPVTNHIFISAEKFFYLITMLHKSYR
jgi:hypothetical protein